jgi:hypothetical protein
MRRIMMRNKFVDLLKSKRELNHELIVGNVEMPATLVWDEDCEITDYAIRAFKALMESECSIKDDCIEVECDDFNMGEKFALATAGFIASSEFDKMFIYH